MSFIKYIQKLKLFSKGTWVSQIIFLIAALVAALVNYIIYIDTSSKMINTNFDFNTILNDELLKYSFIGWSVLLAILLILTIVFWILFLSKGFKVAQFIEYDFYKNPKKIKACAVFGIFFSFFSSMFAEKYCTSLLTEIKENKQNDKNNNNYQENDYQYEYQHNHVGYDQNNYYQQEYDRFHYRNPYDEHVERQDVYYYDNYPNNNQDFLCIDQTSIKSSKKKKRQK